MHSNLSRETWNDGNGRGVSLAEYMEREAEKAEHAEREREIRNRRAAEIRRASQTQVSK